MRIAAACLVFLFVYINIGYALASFCWRRRELTRRDLKKEGFIDFLLWPLTQWGEYEEAPLIDEAFMGSEVPYKVAVSFSWPLKVVFNSFIFAIIFVFFAFAIAWRLMFTLVILVTYPARRFLGDKSIGQVGLRALWLKPIFD